MFEEFDFPRSRRRPPQTGSAGRAMLWLAAFSWAFLMLAGIVAGLARVGDGPTMPDAIIFGMLLFAFLGFVLAFVVDRTVFAGKR